MSRQNMANGTEMCMDAISFFRFFMLLIFCKRSTFSSQFISGLCVLPAASALATLSDRSTTHNRHQGAAATHCACAAHITKTRNVQWHLLPSQSHQFHDFLSGMQ